MFNDETLKIKVNGKVFYVKESHFHQHPEVFGYLTEALHTLLANGTLDNLQGTLKTSIDFAKPIGTTDCIPTDAEDEVFYAQRRGRKTFTRFVKNKPAPECSTLTMVLAQGNKPNRINVITAYVGYAAEREPLDSSIKTQDEFDRCVEFWKTHALVEKSQRIYHNTITSECPWDRFDNRPQIVLGNNNNVTEIIAKLRQSSLENGVDTKPRLDI